MSKKEKEFKFEDSDTRPAKDTNKEKIKDENKKLIKEISELQELMLAENKHGLIIVLQWLDAAWKSWVIKNICHWINPMWVKVHSFKSPTQEEREHDFLWRIHRAVPDVWSISIFDRSHYEDIIMPTLLKTHSKHQIEKRYDHINNFEQMLEDEWIIVIKFFLNVSEDAQLERLHERMTNPRKMRKYNEWDWSKREDRKHILEIAENVINKCNTVEWHVIPSDENRYKVNQIAKIIVKRLKKLDMKRPKLATDYSAWKIDE